VKSRNFKSALQTRAKSAREDKPEQKTCEAGKREDKQKDSADDQRRNFLFVLRAGRRDAKVDGVEVVHKRQEDTALLAGFDWMGHQLQDKHSQGPVQRLASQSSDDGVTKCH
jgi:hypothetical protein